MSNFHILLKVSNVLVYLYFLSATVYSSISPIDDKHDTYLTPAAWVLYAWSAVHVLLGGYIIYQWFPPAHDGVVHGVGWHFVGSTILNSIWFYFWNKNTTVNLVFGFIALLFTTSSVSYVFYNLEKNHPTSNWFDLLFIHAPFSIWHGFIIVLATENLFAIFTSVQKHGPDVFHIVLVEIALFFLTSTAIGYIEYKNQKGDVLGALVIAYSLFAISYQQQDPIIHWSAFGFGVLTVLYPIRNLIKLLKGQDPASAPLLG